MGLFPSQWQIQFPEWTKIINTMEKSIKLLQTNPCFLYEKYLQAVSMWRCAPRSFSGSLQCGGKTLILERLVTPTTKGAIAEIAMKGTSPKRLRKTYGYGGPQSQHPHRNSWDLSPTNHPQLERFTTLVQLNDESQMRRTHERIGNK